MALGHKTPRPALEDIRVLSIGTGLTPTIISLDTTNWGIIQWLLNPFRKPQTPLLNILFDGVVEADVDEQAYVEGALHPRKPEASQANRTDDWKAIPQLIQTAKDYDLDPAIDWIEKHWN